jgi:CarD family transcriptional regulator
MSESQFKINDYVVYPSHGMGQIIDKETQNIAGINLEVFVINFNKDRMILRVPVSRAEACGLRPILNKETFENEVLEILVSKPKIHKGMWSRRSQDYENKINSGNLLEIAQIAKDLFRNVDDNPDCSYSERSVYETARERIATEYSIIYNVNIQTAINDIERIMREKIIA